MVINSVSCYQTDIQHLEMSINLNIPLKTESLVIRIQPGINDSNTVILRLYVCQE